MEPVRSGEAMATGAVAEGRWVESIGSSLGLRSLDWLLGWDTVGVVDGQVDDTGSADGWCVRVEKGGPEGVVLLWSWWGEGSVGGSVGGNLKKKEVAGSRTLPMDFSLVSDFAGKIPRLATRVAVRAVAATISRQRSETTRGGVAGRFLSEDHGVAEVRFERGGDWIARLVMTCHVVATQNFCPFHRGERGFMKCY